MKFGKILVCFMANISNMFLANAEDWKLIPGSLMFLLKERYREIRPLFNLVIIPY